MTNLYKLIRRFTLLSFALTSVFVLCIFYGSASGSTTLSSSGGSNSFDDGAAHPYPLKINVSGLVGTITSFEVTLNHVTATDFGGDLQALLVGPGGQSIYFFGGDSGDFNLGHGPVNWTFSDSAKRHISVTGGSPSGTYLPKAFNSNFRFSGNPAPAPYGSFEDFVGTDPNGVWSLYLQDTVGEGFQRIGGWELSFYLTDFDSIASALFSSAPTAFSLRESSFHSSRVGINNFNQRLYNLRNRSTRKSPGVASNDSPIVEGQGDGPEVNKSGKSAKDVLPPSVNVIKPERWEVYTSFGYSDLDMEEDVNFEGLRSNTYSTGVGAEYALTPYLTMGLGTSYLTSDVKGGNDSGNTDVEGFTFVGYASAYWNGLYADLLYGASFLNNDIDRDTGLGTTAHAKPNSVVQSVNFNTGYNFTLGQFVTGPYAGIDYAHSDVDGYTEHGGGTANTRVSGQTNDSLLTRLGWQASYNIVKPWGKITPQINAGWERENLNSSNDVTVGLVQSPFYHAQRNSIQSLGGFSSTVASPGRAQDYMTAGAALIVEVGTRFNVVLDYQGNFFAQGFAAHYAGIKVGYKF